MITELHNYATRQDTFSVTSMDSLVRDLRERAQRLEHDLFPELAAQDAHDLAAGFLTLDESMKIAAPNATDVPGHDVPSDEWPCTELPEPTDWLTPWIDLGPAHDVGDIGGDQQVGIAYGRRFIAQHVTRYLSGKRKGQVKGSEWAVVDLAIYLARNDDVPDGWYEVAATYTLCTDYRDPGSTETWSDHRYGEHNERVPTDYDEDGELVPDVEKANKRALELARDSFSTEDLDTVAWTGEQFTAYHEAPRPGKNVSW